MIGGLIGVHASSIVYWGYQDNFKPVYFFLQKELKRKTNDFHPLRSLCARKVFALVV